ncbi:MAG: DUF885 domain-containing protein [Pseudomonadota bacterium]|nr:DUF885 domain-containing protein [Pseudomonadota bacterium]
MIRKIFISILIVLLVGGSIYALKLFVFKPFSLNHFLTRELVYDALKSPEILTYMGVLEEYGFRSHNGKLSDYSLKKDSDDLREIKKDYRIVNSYQDEHLTPDELTSKKIALFQLRNEIDERTKYPYHNYPLRQMNGLHTQILEFMTDVHPIKDLKDGEYYLSRLEMIPIVFSQILEKMTKRKELKIFPPTFMVQRVIDQINNVLSLSIDENPIITIFEEKLLKLELTEEQVSDLRERAIYIFNEKVLPSYKSLLKHMEEILPLANLNDGVWSLPDGDNYYALKLRKMTTSNFTAEEIHQIGLSEVERISRQITKILKAEGYENFENIGSILIQLNESDRFLFPDTQESREEIINIYNDIIIESSKIMSSYFHRLPKADVIVKPVPSYSEESAAGGYYRGPSMDGTRPGIFYANLYDIKATPKFGMKTLAFHEAIPGHHFQIALNLENKELGFYRRFGVNATAYTEGWALYAEQLAVEIGLSEDPFDKIGFLQSELFRAVRLVVDTGIHYKKWTREEAITYMFEKTGKAMSSVVAEIERYISWPGQACSYKIGMIKILELRQKTKELLGEDFEIKDFHDFIIENGEIPLTILEDNFKKWIETKI